MKIKISKSQWEDAGKKAGWIKTAQGRMDRNEEEMYPTTGRPSKVKSQEEQDKRLNFSYGATPESVIKERVNKETPSGYSIHIKNKNEWSVLAKAVNKGMDDHLEGFTRSKFDSKTGKCLIHPEEMTTLLRRLFENGDDESLGLRSDILETLGIEEI